MQKSHRSGDQGQARRWWCRAFDCEAYKKPLSVTPPGHIGEMFNMPSEVRDLSHEIDHLLALSGVDSVHLLREGIESVGELKCAVESSCSDDSGLTDRGRSVGINRLHPVYESVKVISVRHEPSAENPPVPRHDDRQPYPRSSGWEAIGMSSAPSSHPWRSRGTGGIWWGASPGSKRPDRNKRILPCFVAAHCAPIVVMAGARWLDPSCPAARDRDTLQVFGATFQGSQADL